MKKNDVTGRSVTAKGETKDKDKLVSGAFWGQSRRLFLSAAGSAILAAPSALAYADSGTPSSFKPEIEEIVVTARRKAENVQSIPLSVTALTPDVLQRENVTDVHDLSRVVPSLSVANVVSNRDSAAFFIRGQSAAPFGAEPAVLVYFAEVPTLAEGSGILYDLANVQVLKGPQGTLFGRNTTGGAVLIEPEHPGNKFGGYIDAQAGNYDMKRAQGAVDLPIVDDKLLVRFAFDRQFRGGFTTDIVTDTHYDDRNYQAYRLSIMAKPVEKFEDRLVLSYFTSRTHGGGNVLAAIDANPADPFATAVQVFGAPLISEFAAQQARGARFTSLNGNSSQLARDYGLTNIASYNVTDALVLKNIFGIRVHEAKEETDVDGSPFPIVTNLLPPAWGSGNAGDPATRSFSDEMQLQGKSLDEKLSWILGLYAEYSQPVSKDDRDPLVEFGTPNIILQALKRDRSKAAFGQFTYDLSDWIPKLKLTAGARYTRDQRSQLSRQYLASSSSSQVPLVCFFGPLPGCALNFERPFHAGTGNISLDYQLDPTTLLYVATRHGYKSGGFNTTASPQLQATFGPEFVDDVELGVKTDFHIGDAPVRLDGNVYRGWYRQLQQSSVAFTVCCGEVVITSNDPGKTVVQGIELEGRIKPIHDLELSSSYAYTDATHGNDFFLGANISGAPFMATPRHKFSINARYDWELGDNIGVFSPSITYTYQSRVYFLEPLFPILTNPNRGQPGYGLVNARLDWSQALNYPIDLSFFITNLTDKIYKAYENDSYQTGGYTNVIYGEPRMFGVDMHYSF